MEALSLEAGELSLQLTLKVTMNDVEGLTFVHLSTQSVCVCVGGGGGCCSSIGLRVHLENGNIWDLAGLQVQVTVMVSYGIISLSKERTHNCFSRLRSIHGYLVFDLGGHDC